MYFVTGNKNKFLEVQAMMPEVKQIALDLPEIQEINPQVIIEAKLLEAKKHISDSFFVEDTSLYIDALGGLPGPLIKWFMQTLKPDGLYKIIAALGNTKATAKTVIGLYDNTTNSINYFVGEVVGNIVEPIGETTFGRDPLFQPIGYTDTFATMSKEIKNTISMRRKAIEQVQQYLSKV